MSARLMEPGIEAALDSGRVLIVPSAHRAGALRWNWARLQLARRREVWETPRILTWDAWLEDRWERARLAGRVAPQLRRLNRSQQLQLWQRVLAGMEGQFGESTELAQHAAALMDSAARAVQWLLPLSRLAISDEEKLLAAALAQARDWCRRHECIALPLCGPVELAAFIDGPAPLVAGQRQLTALQRAVGEQCWPDEQLLHEATQSPHAGSQPQLVVARSLAEEIRACARWCEALLAEDAERRLLVIGAVAGLSTDVQALLLARELSAGTGEVPEDVLQAGVLAVEGGRALVHQQLIADALAALRLLREPLSFDDLSQVLRSAYLQWGSATQMLALRAHLAQIGLAQWPAAALATVLDTMGEKPPAASLFAEWLAQSRAWTGVVSRVEWARRFSRWLGAAQFARGVALDSRDAQRLQRWNELLDEFAALDATGEPLRLADAVEGLLQLAGQARHAARSGDAAITLTAERGAPLARYDGIWVLGLSEQRWPEPPRPDPYVPLQEQRRCGWDEAGARQRLEQAAWSLQQWRACTAQLVLSHPRLEGDVHHRPSMLSGLAQPHLWQDAADDPVTEPFCLSPAQPPGMLAPLPKDPGRPLRRGLQRLRLQQACAFRGQAEIRLGAEAAALTGDGIHPKVRGILLHGLFDGIWRELGDQRSLAALDVEARGALFERHWAAQIARLVAEGWPPYRPRVLERERHRSRRLVLRVFELEGQRPYFRVLWGERQLQLATPAGVMSLRVDRLDEDDQGLRWLIDYKSGAPETFRLARGEAQPLQLALYEQALAAGGDTVQGMALLSLKPAKPGYSGAADESTNPAAWPGKWQRIDDWDTRRASWRAELAHLLQAHVEGQMQVAPLRDACRLCHLSALCRRADPADDAATDDAAEDEDV